MTDNSDFTSRPQHPDAASTPSESAQSATPAAPPTPEQPPAAPVERSPYERPALPQTGEPASDYAPPPAPQPAVDSAAAPQPNGFSQTGAQPTAAYPTAANDQPTTEYPRTQSRIDDAEPRRKTSKTVPLVAAALAVGAIVGGASGAGIASLALNNNSSQTQNTSSTPTTVTVNQPDDATVVTAAAAAAAPSTVTVFVTSDVAGGSGSGVVFNDDGYIITNSHVVTLGGQVANAAVQVQTTDGRLLDAEVVGRDPIADIAVIKVADGSDLPPATFADSDELNVGDTTVVLGAPLGLANSVSSGIVSALSRSITVSSSEVPDSEAPEGTTEETQPPFDFWNFDIPGQEQNQQNVSSSVSLAVIQTDAAINQGNSGGALVNEQGQVIGINVAIASSGGEGSGNIGLGFAIPSNLAQRVAQELIDGGKGSHGLLGASVIDAAADTEANAHVVGASIQELTADGAAQAAGLRVGDIVTAVNGVAITSSTDLTAQIRALAGGSEAKIAYVRGGDASTVNVKLGELG
jgi:putative serine protease PepD